MQTAPTPAMNSPNSSIGPFSASGARGPVVFDVEEPLE